MRIKEGFILREAAGCYLVVAVGSRAREFNGVININETGAFMWKQLKKDVTEEDIVKALLNEYEVTEEKAKEDVNKFIGKLKEANLLV